ncbi:MAG: hypothetical protein A2V62_03250 [Nitrospirae bacterium RBG_19FT_COMBO_58_9]|nr:MAG: hypothetical protein A2V62_03250 [Nitrospirae bacterium RBG_19FT_COMBO_58_9]
MIVPGHRPIPLRIDKSRCADGLLVETRLCGKRDDLVGEAIREVKNRIGSLQPLFKIGDQICRQEISKAPFGEETERGVARIENDGVQLRPIGDTHERRDRLARLAALIASLQKGVTGTLSVTKDLPNMFDDLLSVRHDAFSSRFT